MAQLYFYYSAMNAGKSTTLLQSAHNYRERGMRTLLYTPHIDHQNGRPVIHSRIGITAEAIPFTETYEFLHEIQQEHQEEKVHCVLIDESQFLTAEQVLQLTVVCDQLSIPVLCYGIRTDFRGELFPGSLALLSLADNIIELKTICEYPSCSRKATMIARYDKDGEIVLEGNQIDIGADKYKVYCRKHYRELTKII